MHFLDIIQRTTEQNSPNDSQQPERIILSQQQKQWMGGIRRKIIEIEFKGIVQENMYKHLEDEIQGRRDQLGRATTQFMEVSLTEKGYRKQQYMSLNRHDHQVLVYFSKLNQIQQKISECEKAGRYRQLLLLGLKLMKQTKINKQHQLTFNHQQFINILIFNNAVCYKELNMFKQALHTLTSLGKQKQIGQKFRENADKLKRFIGVRMGRVDQKKIDHHHKGGIKMASKISTDHWTQWFDIMNKSKQELIDFVRKITSTLVPLTINNSFNLCIRCKQFGLNQEVLPLLNTLKNHSALEKEPGLKTKCLVLLSQVHQAVEDHQKAIDTLQEVVSTSDREQSEINLRVCQLGKKLRMKAAVHTCPYLTPLTTHKYHLLQELQLRLNSLVDQPKQIKKQYKKLQSSLYTTLSKKITSSTISLKSSRNLIVKKQSKISNATESIEMNKLKTKTKTLKKVVRFQTRSQNNAENNSRDIIYQCQEKIMGAILNDQKQKVVQEIERAMVKLQEHRGVIPTSSGYKFIKKCAQWYQQIGQPSLAIALLNSLLPKIDQNTQLKISTLQQLSTLYQQLYNYKKIIQVNLQLYKLGELDCLDKVGETYILLGNYSDAIKYYEHYCYLKPSQFTDLKLAHAYSKQYTLLNKAISILDKILFENRTNGIFRNFAHSELQLSQGALLLLASLYLQTKNIKKAQQICEQYLKKYFSAYPIYYLLGTIHLQYYNSSSAFAYFINALKLKPNHIPSLIQVVKYVQSDSLDKSRVIEIVRKGFAYQHKNWDLLKLFMGLLTGKSSSFETISTKGLIHSALTFDQLSNTQLDLKFEAELIWKWALEQFKQEKAQGNCNDKQELTILIRLGQLNLQKGNYKMSQQYFTQVLERLQQIRKKTSKTRLQSIHLELQILQKLVFLKLQQSNVDQAFRLMDCSQDLALTGSLNQSVRELQWRKQCLLEMYSDS